MLKITDDQLEKGTWIMQGGANVNPVPADAFISSLLADGTLKVTNVSSKAFGGALVTNKRPMQTQAGASMPFVGMDMDVYVSSYDLANLARLEIDLKCVAKAAPNAATPIPNTANFSAQWNLDAKNGQWQLDPSGTTWVDSGFKPTLAPDTWTTLKFRFWMSAAAGKWSILSVDWGGVLFVAPSQFQNIPLLPSNWNAVAAIQLQTEVFTPGSLTVLFRNIKLTYGDQPF